MKNKLGLMMAVMVIAGYSQVALAQNLDEGLVAYYPFNGNANDESGNGNDGEVNGATLVEDRHGETGKAYSFEGEDHIKIDTRFDGMRDATLSLWFKGNEKVQPRQRVTFIQTASIMLLIQNMPDNHVHHGHKIYAFFHDDRNGNSSKPWSSERLFVPKFKQDAWNHIVVRIDDSDNCYLTMNGESIALQSSNRDLPGGVYIDSFIGGVDGGSGVLPGVRGDMDDIRIYNRALSDAEVAALYELEKKPKADLTTDLVAYYPFNGNANDESGNGNHGIVNGVTLAEDRHGEPAKAYKFDGNDYIKVNHNSKLNAGNNFSLSVWYTVEGPSNNDYGTIVGKDGRNSGWWLSTARSGNTTTKIRWQHVSVGSIIKNKTFNYSPVTWHHSVIVYNNRNASFYLDNKLIEEKKLTNSSGVSSSDLLIGQQFSGISGRGWKGKIDDIRIYSRALSEKEVAELYEEPQDDLVAYYPFNGNANDESGNGNHGEVIGAELSTDRHGKKNAAYKFDGSNDYISLGTAERYTEKLSGSLTLSAWFNASKHHHGVIFQFGEGIDGRANQVIGIGLETGRILANIRGANGEGAGTRFVYTDTDVHDTKWHHIVLVKEENNYNYLYLDGDLVFSEKDTSGSINPISSDIVHVGRALSGNGYNAYFNGYIDDLRMYSIALTGPEVVGMYELEKPETVIPPQITAISENTVADEGETIELTVVADGEGPLLYSWKKTGSNVELSNTTNLVLSNVDEGDAGSYYVVVSNEGGKTDSATVEIDIRPDTDNDGLLDYEEIALGSDINKADTDGDGLSDFDEVDLFSTSPIRPDTDGDGLDDGSEIRGGFDPRKPTESADGSISIKVAVELEFFTLTWNNYQLQRSKDLIQWQDVDAPFKGVGGYSSILQTARKDKIYWRLKIID